MPKFTYLLPLRWADADSYGHVNNSRYLTIVSESTPASVRRWRRTAPG